MSELAQGVNQALRRVPRWPLFPLGLIPAGLLVHALLTGGLGPDPMKVMEQRLGEIGLQFLIATLCVTPLRNYAGISLIKYRRAFGLLAFYYILMHLLTWVVLDYQFHWAEMMRDLYKRPYITVGMFAFAAMLPLALTASDHAIRRLGAATWQRLHKLAYLAALAGALHYLLLVKRVTAEPVLYALAVLLLLAMRAHWRRVRQSRRA
ncbi:protein-methionine-sulfoxide reductase heme-binding subunit MsrQ [Maritimibacter sp. 55A14]|uniref:protein-methionine-sulfoxide reductase heme-binding subunit MsrQ n=1 Tax=Maritimibacter sp. 55A14 TaxID=2174844 RepID=UPI000D6080B4|nr:protein-methionine-sulfoxide reductase heme-binding subunit MsrQ [Maritimibacter sp. 55A14]PWE29936.1 protein-methionine-sulfoxide reductase heme-binding subunit MsrQ [Maritimibacter sp. 55A14]